MCIILLLLQVGFIAKVKLHFYSEISIYLHLLTASFAIMTMSLELLAIFSAVLMASFTSWSGGNTFATKPTRKQYYIEIFHIYSTVCLLAQFVIIMNIAQGTIINDLGWKTKSDSLRPVSFCSKGHIGL